MSMVVALLVLLPVVTTVDDLAGKTSREGGVRLRAANSVQKSCWTLFASGRLTLTCDVMLEISRANLIPISLRLTGVPVLSLILSIHWHVFPG
jgi:hypothetical protein